VVGILISIIDVRRDTELNTHTDIPAMGNNKVRKYYYDLKKTISIDWVTEEPEKRSALFFPKVIPKEIDRIYRTTAD